MFKLSFFGKTLYSRCPQSYNAMYNWHVRGAKRDKRTAYEGSVWHALMENWFKQPVLDSQWLHDHVDVTIAKFLAKEKVIFKSELDRVKGKAKIIKMINGGVLAMNREGMFHEKILKQARVEHVLKKATIKGKIRLTGRIDWVDEFENFVDIWDWKGVGKYAGLSYEQLAVYRYAARQEFQKDVRKTGFVMGLFGDVVHYVENLWPESRVEEEFLKTAELIAKKVFPCKPHRWACKDCGVQEGCEAKYSRDKKVSAIKKELNNAIGRSKTKTGFSETKPARIKL